MTHPHVVAATAVASCYFESLAAPTRFKENLMRLPLIPPAELTAEQRPPYDNMKAGMGCASSDQLRQLEL